MVKVNRPLTKFHFFHAFLTSSSPGDNDFDLYDDDAYHGDLQWAITKCLVGAGGWEGWAVSR